MTWDGAKGYKWDGFNRLREVSDGGGTIVTFVYDAQNRLARKDRPGTTNDIDYGYTGWQVVEQYEAGDPEHDTPKANLSGLLRSSYPSLSLTVQNHIHDVLSQDRLFSMDELKVMYDRIGLDWDDLPGEQKGRLTMEMIKRAHHSGRLAGLVREIERLRAGALRLPPLLVKSLETVQ